MMLTRASAHQNSKPVHLVSHYLPLLETHQWQSTWLVVA